jgi:hypothetical protein
MNTTLKEQRIEYEYTSPSGATVRIRHVPIKTRVDMFGQEHRVLSIAVALRLEELRKQAFAVDNNAQAVHELEF